ncbi:MAG: MarR family transcriptional regulator, partial [Anaerolineae bacterium]|nr:MarR family transcriptional regulator [Anaerolineae bacterium]
MSFSLDSSLGFLTNRLANLLKADLERGFAARGLNITAEQWLILGRLYEEDGLVQNELAKRTSKDKTNIARIL